MNNCYYYDPELDCCRYFSDWQDPMTLLAPCVQSPCEKYKRGETKLMNQKQITLSHIELYIKKVKTAEIESVKVNYMNKTVGILSLANRLEIITPEEYEHYFKEIYS